MGKYQLTSSTEFATHWLCLEEGEGLREGEIYEFHYIKELDFLNNEWLEIYIMNENDEYVMDYMRLEGQYLTLNY